MDKIIAYLGSQIIDTRYTEQIGRRFESILPIILMENVNYKVKQDREFFIQHRRKCCALAKLVTFSSHAQRFALTYFANMPSPFAGDRTISNSVKKKVPKTMHNDELSPLDILKCCYTFLKFDTVFFMRQWKWSEFIEKYGDDMVKQCDEYKYIYNRIVAHLTGLSNAQLSQLNENIPVNVEINFATNDNSTVNRIFIEDALNDIEQNDSRDDEMLKWNLKSEQFANIDGVLLPIFDAKNATFAKNSKRIVLVESARTNLKSIAIGVAAGSAVCLSGSVGSGKTTLIEYLAYRTGRIPPKQFKDADIEMNENGNSILDDATVRKNKKRKAKVMELDEGESASERKSSNQNGFLRIQLGDQTDSKMLLGQYHCTDVPGEFVWQPGVLTQAVMHGYWLLLEDLDQCSRDVCVMLTNFFENNYLSVPGFRDCIQISSGFRIFVTRRYVKFTLSFFRLMVFSSLQY